MLQIAQRVITFVLEETTWAAEFPCALMVTKSYSSKYYPKSDGRTEENWLHVYKILRDLKLIPGSDLFTIHRT